MARTLYGGGAADVAVKLSSDGDFEPDTTTTATAWTTGPGTGGSQMTSLAAFQPGTPGTPGAGITVVTAQSDGEILVWGPDPYNGPFWLEYPTGVRRQIYPVDVVSRLATLEAGTGGIPATTIDAKGDILAGTANDTVDNLPVGANATVLEADSTQTMGVKWGGAPVKLATVTTKGDLLAGTASATVARHAAGANGKILSADSTQTTGLAWVDQVAAPDVTGKADKSGSVKQFADWDDATPPSSGIVVPVWDPGTGTYIATDITGLFASLDGSGRITAAQRPKYNPDLIVIVEGDPVPSDAGADGVGAVIFTEAASASVVPVSHGTNSGTTVAAATGVTKATTSDINVGDWVVICVGADGAATLPSTFTVTLAAGAASGGFSSAIESHQTGSAQTNWLIGKCTTAIPSGTNITVKANQTRTELMIGITSVPNLVGSSVVDKTMTAAGGSSSTLNLTSTSSGTLAQPVELALVGFTHNCGNPVIHTQDATSGSGWIPLWAEIDCLAASSGRALRAYYKVTSATTAVQGAITITTSDGVTGAYSGAGITLLAA